MPLVQPNRKYTYHDYLQWDDDERWELIDGVPYNMSPAPNILHQQISINISTLLKIALKKKPCFPLESPTDVVLSDYDVVQPDIFVVCDQKKIEQGRIVGAPDLVIEILSASSNKRDRWDKKALYEKFGVKEYLLIDQEGKYVERYTLEDNGSYSRGTVYANDDVIALHSLESIELPLVEIFDLDIFEPQQSE